MQARIEAKGGRVFAIKYDDGIDGPPRVWLGNMDVPGLAMSRSLGDTVGHDAGIISTFGGVSFMHLVFVCSFTFHCRYRRLPWSPGRAIGFARCSTHDLCFFCGCGQARLK